MQNRAYHLLPPNLGKKWFWDTVEPTAMSGHPWDQRKCLLRRGVRLKALNAAFLCHWDDEQVSAEEAQLYHSIESLINNCFSFWSILSNNIT